MIKKVLVVSRQFWPEDGKLTELCEKLISLGIKVDVLCGQPSNDEGNLYEGYGSFKIRREIHNRVNIYRCFDVRRGEKSNIGLFLNYIFFPLSSMLLIGKLKKNKYDAVLINQMSPVFAGTAGFIIGKKLKIPVYMNVVDLWPAGVYKELDIQSELFRRFLDFLSKKTYRKADKLIVQSEKMRKYFVDVLTRPESDFPIVSLSPDACFAAEIVDVNLLEKTAGSFNCVFFGDCNGWMSPKIIIETAKRLKQDQIKTIRFIVIGAGEKINNLKNLVHSSNLHDYFFFEGNVKKEDYGKYIHLADVVMAVLKVGIINEYSIPQEILNIMNTKKPLLLSMNGITREIIRKEGFGLISEADDADALYNNLKKIYRMSREERYEMGRKAECYLTAHHNSDINAEAVFNILNGTYQDDLENNKPDIKKMWNL